MSSYIIQPLDETLYSAYEEFLHQSDKNLFYSSVPYKCFLEKLLGCSSQYLLALDQQGNIVGALPLMISKPGKFGKAVNSLPYYGSNGGIVLDDHKGTEGMAIRQVLMDACAEQFNSGEYATMTFITNPLYGDHDWYEDYFAGCLRDERIGQITVLPEVGDVEKQLLSIFEEPRPRNIRKAKKSGITWHVSQGADDLAFLCKTHQDNISSIGGLAKDEGFFSLLSQNFREDEYKIFIAEYRGEPVAGLLLFYYNKTVEYFTPAVLKSFRSLQPLSLIILEAMKDAVNRGYKFWNWGGTWLTQKGVYDYKKKWGAANLPYYYYTKLINTDVLQATADELLNEYKNFYTVPFKELDL